MGDVVGLGLTGSAWDGVTGPHPTPNMIHLVPERRAHILDGDATGGGHAPGTGHPGKSEFPTGWTDDKILRAVMQLARDPGLAPTLQKNGRWRIEGVIDGVLVRVIVDDTGFVRTAHPVDGPGVIKNPNK